MLSLAGLMVAGGLVASVAQAGDDTAWTSVEIWDGTKAETKAVVDQQFKAEVGAANTVAEAWSLVYWTGQGEREAVTGGRAGGQAVGWGAQADQAARVDSQAKVGEELESRVHGQASQSSPKSEEGATVSENKVEAQAGAANTTPGKGMALLNAGLALLFGVLGAIL